MRFTEYLPALALAVLLTTAGCSQLPAAGGGTTATTGGEAADSQVIQTAATGSIETSPDQAVVRVGVEVTGDDVEAVRSALAENATAMREALREMGIDDDRIRTTRYDLGQNYRYDPDRRPNEPRYRGQHTFTVSLEDPDRAGDTVVTAVQNGATRVDGVRFTLSDERRRDLQREAVAAGVENARAKADSAAGAAGLTITGVDTVRTTELRAEPYRVRNPRLLSAHGGGGGGGVSPAISQGSVTVTAQVLVTYNATDA
jgi:uncharacterized protein YggE